MRRQEPDQEWLPWNPAQQLVQIEQPPMHPALAVSALAEGAHVQSEPEEAGVIRFGRGGHRPDFMGPSACPGAEAEIDEGGCRRCLVELWGAVPCYSVVPCHSVAPCHSIIQY